MASADTIFALSSGSPPAAIAVVRISGPDAAKAVQALAGRLPEPRRTSLAALRHPQSGDLLDRGLILLFPGPRSATGEDLAELHLHGGRSVVSAILAALGQIGHLRPAEPGEFTRRALENGRIDLTEAEGLADLLAAETESQRRAALILAGGAVARLVEQWQSRLLAFSAAVEAILDFDDEDDVAELGEDWRRALRSLADEISSVLARPPAERLRDGLRVVIAGPPNAGKSTLLNSLVGREAAITSPHAGTTRDVVEAAVAIDGIPFLLADTAGLREAEDVLEAIGVGRSQDQLSRADIILWLGDPADCPDSSRSILVQAKADIDEVNPRTDVQVSAVTGAGIDTLVQHLLSRAQGLLPAESEAAFNRRHREILATLPGRIRSACDHSDPILAAEELRGCRAELDRITGRAGVEDMLNALFGSFCIGK